MRIRDDGGSETGVRSTAVALSLVTLVRIRILRFLWRSPDNRSFFSMRTEGKSGAEKLAE